MQPLNPRLDPAPSRLRYRLQRLMLTPAFRLLLRVGLPVALCAGFAVGWLADPARQDSIMTAAADLRRQIETRPEFMVNLLQIEGASAGIDEDIREIFPYDLPASSFDLDLEIVRDLIEGLPAVASAAVRVRQGGVLMAQVRERRPVAVWRTRDGLGLTDIEGVVIHDLSSRAARPDLPLVVGTQAGAQIPQALEILRAGSVLEPQARGLVRIGARRWDLVLTGGRRIMLPEDAPVRALERVIALDKVENLLDRDVLLVDMRLPHRPTLRMSEDAIEQWWRVTAMTVEAGER